jgi:hypothetical protein
VHLVHETLTYDPARAKLAFVPYLVVQILSDVLAWTAFPFAMIYIARALGREERYFWYMVPYNWFQLPLGLLMFPIFILADLGIVPNSIATFSNLLSLMLFFTFTSFIARVGLQISVMTSIGLVLLDFMLGLFVNQLVAQI